MLVVAGAASSSNSGLELGFVVKFCLLYSEVLFSDRGFHHLLIAGSGDSSHLPAGCADLMISRTTAFKAVALSTPPPGVNPPTPRGAETEIKVSGYVPLLLRVVIHYGVDCGGARSGEGGDTQGECRRRINAFHCGVEHSIDSLLIKEKLKIIV